MTQSLDSAEQKALELQQQLQAQIYTLSLEKQGEYALMLYRTSGNKEYLNTARVTLYLSADRLQQFESTLKNPSAIEQLLNQELPEISPQWMKKYRDYLFHGFLVLPELLRIDQFAMAVKGGVGERLGRAINSVDFKVGLTSPELIKAYGPKQAEQVYALLNLGVGDYRHPFIDTFRNLYPDKSDAELPPEELLHKWRVMAHLVLAASDQLQEPVNDPLLQWIPEYFLANAKSVIMSTDQMLQAKIGLVLLLTGYDSTPLLQGIRQQQIKRPLSDKITQEDFWSMLLLGWVKDYYPDPALYQIKQFRNKNPFILKPQE